MRSKQTVHRLSGCVFVCVCASESYHCRLQSKQTVHRLSLCTKRSILMFVCVLVASTQLLHVNKQHSYCSESMSYIQCSNKYAHVNKQSRCCCMSNTGEGEGSRHHHVTGTDIGTGSEFGLDFTLNPDAEVTIMTLLFRQPKTELQLLPKALQRPNLRPEAPASPTSEREGGDRKSVV